MAVDGKAPVTKFNPRKMKAMSRTFAKSRAGASRMQLVNARARVVVSLHGNRVQLAATPACPQATLPSSRACFPPSSRGTPCRTCWRCTCRRRVTLSTKARNCRTLTRAWTPLKMKKSTAPGLPLGLALALALAPAAKTTMGSTTVRAWRLLCARVSAPWVTRLRGCFVFGSDPAWDEPEDEEPEPEEEGRGLKLLHSMVGELALEMRELAAEIGSLEARVSDLEA